MASNVKVQFMDGEAFDVSLSNTRYVCDLLKVVKTLKRPPFGAQLKLLSEMTVLKPLDLVDQLAGITLNAVYSKSGLNYLMVHDGGNLILVAEGDEEWDEETAGRAQCPEERWVPAPDVMGATRPATQPENLAKDSYGVIVSATSNRLNMDQSLLNVLRLGSKFGEPRCVLGREIDKCINSFIFNNGDQNPTLTMDFGRTVVLTRIGSTCYHERAIKYFEVWSSADADSNSATWESWGTVRNDFGKDSVVFVDRAPTSSRLVRIKATSRRGVGAQVGPLFAYGWS